MTKEERNAYKKEYYKAHKDAYKAANKAWCEAHKEQIKAYQKAYQKAYKKAHKEQVKAASKAWCEANREQYKAYQKEYYKAHKEELKAYRQAHKEQIKAYTKSDVNSLGQTKQYIRKKSQRYLKKYGRKIPGYQIHHCCTYAEPYKFIYCSIEMHRLIHAYLRQHNIDADTDHYIYIKHLLDDTTFKYNIE